MNQEIVSKSESKDNIIKEENASGQENMADELPPEVSRIIEELPPEERKRITSFLMMSSIQSSPLSPIFKKLTPDHITKIIDSSDKNNQRSYEFALWSKLNTFIVLLLGLGLFLFLTIFLAKSNVGLYKDIVQYLFTFLGGFGIGYAYKKFKED
jgi:hypothetical protein